MCEKSVREEVAEWMASVASTLLAEQMNKMHEMALNGAFCQHMKEPPVGVMPRSIWLSKRRQEIYDAMTRYKDAGFVVPEEWKEELNNLF